MLNLIAIGAFLAFGVVTAALIWAVLELERHAGVECRWQPGARPHSWRL